MTEDNRIREIGAYHHRVSGLQGEGIGSWCSCSDLDCKVLFLLDRLAALEQPAPRVWFPGDTVPRGAAAMNEDGDLVAGAYRVMAIDGPQVELATLSPEQWQAAVDRARDARADAEWQHTEGTTP